MKRMKSVLFVLSALMLVCGTAQAYIFEGDAAAGGAGFTALDGTWDHDNGSDEWDETGVGMGRPGGVSALTEGDTTYVRIQDTGDPRDYGMGDPGSNRKIYLGHEIDFGLDGAQLEFRARVATGPPLDDQHPDGGGGVAPWPAGGIGYHIRDGGKGMFGIGEIGTGILSFSLALQSELAGYAGYEAIATDALLLNELNGAAATGDIETGDTGVASYVPVGDITSWHTYLIDIAVGGSGTHQLSISIDGGAPTVVDVTAGDDYEWDDLGIKYIAMGSSGTGGITAFDVDYFSAVPEPATVALLGLGGLALLRRKRG
ncbi:MAG: PEP-CTERM sorting domain-containing protein [Phycisphaerales bacterium]|nr:MAG: PEP-CTERM sorting domain-containing protein [Phycisphaerales bacterium]